VRTPSRSSNDIRFAAATNPGDDDAPLTSTIIGSSGVDAENLIAYESGFRTELAPSVSLDMTGYYNDYSDLESLEPQPPVFAAVGGIANTVSPLFIENHLDGHSYGGELSVDWRVNENWRLVGYYTYLQMQLTADASSGDTTSEEQEGQSPENQLALRSLLNLPGDLEFDSTLRYVDDLPALDVGGYLELDLRLAWQAAKNLEISVVGQNLLDSSHEEFSTTLPAFEKVAVERGVYGKVIWTY
jgi:iron complex outermembrane receptor protein